jgi:hypothetical protein
MSNGGDSHVDLEALVMAEAQRTGHPSPCWPPQQSRAPPTDYESNRADVLAVHDAARGIATPIRPLGSVVRNPRASR